MGMAKFIRENTCELLETIFGCVNSYDIPLCPEKHYCSCTSLLMAAGHCWLTHCWISVGNTQGRAFT